MNALRVATDLADKIKSCRNDNDLFCAAQEVKKILNEFPELQNWREWLLTIYYSTQSDLKAHRLTRDDFNNEGKKAIAKGELVI